MLLNVVLCFLPNWTLFLLALQPVDHLKSLMLLCLFLSFVRTDLEKPLLSGTFCTVIKLWCLWDLYWMPLAFSKDTSLWSPGALTSLSLVYALIIALLRAPRLLLSSVTVFWALNEWLSIQQWSRGWTTFVSLLSGFQILYRQLSNVWKTVALYLLFNFSVI